MIYIVDIDQTICHTPAINGKQRYDLSLPYSERIEKINKLYDEGHTIIYWTARGSGSGINQFQITHSSLMAWGAKFHEVRLGKPSYDVWIDDKAFSDIDFFGSLPAQE
jgi:hypothetical protein